LSEPSDNQRWYIENCEDGYVKIISKASGMVVDVALSGNENGTIVWQHSDTGTDAQRFNFVSD
jgi:hypothetical protein